MSKKREQSPVHRLATRSYAGYDEWNLNRFLALFVPPVLFYVLGWALFPGNNLVPVIGVIIGGILALAPPFKNQGLYERMVSGVQSLVLSKLHKGVVLGEDDSGKPQEQRLGSTKPVNIPVFSEDGESGFLLTYLSSSDPRMETFYIFVDPKGDKSFLDPEDRYARDNTVRDTIRQLTTASVKHGSALLDQVPLNGTPILEHYRGGRFRYGDRKTSLDVADPLESALVNHVLSVHHHVIETQPDSRQVLVLRMKPGSAWEGRKPQRLTNREWNRSPMQATLDRALTAVKLTGDVPQRPTTLQLYAYIRSCLDPYNAEAVYRQLWEDERLENMSATDTPTFKAGPFPTPIVATRDNIRVGDAYHAFIEVDGFTGGSKAEPGFFDGMFHRWEAGSYMSHFVDWRVQGAWLQEHTLQFASDVLDQRAADSGLFRPKRTERLEETQAAYENVARAGVSMRGSWHLRLTSGRPNYLAWMVRDTLSFMIDAGISGFHVRGSSRQVKLLERSIGCAVR